MIASRAYESTLSTGSNNMKASIMLKTGTLHEVNTQVVHPYTKLDTESARMVADKVFERFTGSAYASAINADQARRMIEVVNRAVGRREQVTDDDVKDFLEYHDRDKDSVFSKGDLHVLCEQYLTGPGGNGLNLTNKHTAREDLIEYFIQDEDPNVRMPEMTHVSKLFDSYDKDGDGALDRFEVRSLLTDTYKILKRSPPTESDLDSYMRGKDTITKQEFISKTTNSLMKRSLVKDTDN